MADASVFVQCDRTFVCPRFNYRTLLQVSNGVCIVTLFRKRKVRSQTRDRDNTSTPERKKQQKKNMQGSLCSFFFFFENFTC